MKLGIDLEQFVTDPFASGVQRVVQYLAKEWPAENPADWIVPTDATGEYAILTSDQAAELVTFPFENPMHVSELPGAVRKLIAHFSAPRISENDLEHNYDLWFLPEVCYTPKVLKRFERIQRHTTTAMIGFDALPMSDPYSYKFTPGTLATVSEYFRLIATTDILMCISDFTKNEALNFLRRDQSLVTTVVHPGGDHVPPEIKQPNQENQGKRTYLRVGTMEARKQPVEILQAFLNSPAAMENTAVLHFVGAPARVDVDINFAIEQAIEAGHPVRWTTDASDEVTTHMIREADVFLSYGREGYGIPVLEAIQLGTPVFYGGVQPAAEIMQGHGASPAPINEVFNLPIPAPITSEDQANVPRWADFARSVALTLVDSMEAGIR